MDESLVCMTLAKKSVVLVQELMANMINCVGCILSTGASGVEILDDKIVWHSCIQDLNRFLPPSISSPDWEQAIFRQDNVPARISSATGAWLPFHEIKVWDWSACSPNLKLIENLSVALI